MHVLVLCGDYEFPFKSGMDTCGPKQKVLIERSHVPPREAFEEG